MQRLELTGRGQVPTVSFSQRLSPQRPNVYVQFQNVSFSCLLEKKTDKFYAMTVFSEVIFTPVIREHGEFVLEHNSRYLSTDVCLGSTEFESSNSCSFLS